MKKLFENIEGNKFKLLIETSDPKHELVESGLKKVFTNATENISYKRVESVGLGYIKDVSEAQRVALETARQLCESFGYKDDENSAKFVKSSLKEMGVDVVPYEPNSSHEESEEKREVQIGNMILQFSDMIYSSKEDDNQKYIDLIKKYATELIKMHEQQ